MATSGKSTSTSLAMPVSASPVLMPMPRQRCRRSLQLLQRLHAAVAPGLLAWRAGVPRHESRRRGRGSPARRRCRAPAAQRLRVGAHDAVVGIVEHHLEIQPADPRGAVEARGFSAEGARPTLVVILNSSRGRSVRKPPTRCSERPRPYQGARVVVADAALPGGFQRGARFGLVDPGIELAQVRRAEAEGGSVRRVAPTWRRSDGNTSAASPGCPAIWHGSRLPGWARHRLMSRHEIRPDPSPFPATWHSRQIFLPAVEAACEPSTSLLPWQARRRAFPSLRGQGGSGSASVGTDFRPAVGFRDG